ncbi:hypothetical protein TNCT_327331 [Trichonephila clavata]|uniref:Uncharacterized protein n=1 Tax=Trichonephila clavata TaxID=2740835 RepID=A0A8X6LDL8_TRICU|nr:hypothetical protein TNCT_327331 [Trichonephila clavata]
MEWHREVIFILIPILFKQPPHDLVVECRRLKDSKKIGNVMKSMKFIQFEIEYLESAHIALGYSKEIAESLDTPPRNFSSTKTA